MFRFRLLLLFPSSHLPVRFDCTQRVLLVVATLTLGRCVLPASGHAQTGASPFWSWLSVSGSAGVRADGYAASDIPSREPGLSSEVFADISAEAFGATTGINLLYSTQSNELRQSMNRLGFNTSWEWGQVSAGTVSPDYSQYSLSGETLRGAAVELTPGRWRFGAAGGQSKRAVESRSSNVFQRSAYARRLYAARLGYGSDRGSGAHLIGTYARDRPSSLPASTEVRPAENLTVTPDFRLALFDRRITLDTELTVSVFTPDSRAAQLSDIPFSGALPITPRVGTHVDYAGTSQLQLRLDPLDVRARYKRVQPGFRSLGLSRIRSDEETIELRPQVRLFDNAVTVSLTLQQSRNNLLDQRLTTRRRRQGGMTVQGRVSRLLSISGSLMRMNNVTTATGSDSLSQAMERRFGTTTASVSPSLTIQGESIVHTVTLSGNTQQSTIRPGTGSTQTRNLSTTLTYTTSFPSGLSLTVNGDMLHNTGRLSSRTSYGTNGSVGYTFLEGTLRTNTNLGWSVDRRAGHAQQYQYRIALDSSYRLPFGDRIQLTLRNLNNVAAQGGDRSYRETRVSLRYSHSF